MDNRNNTIAGWVLFACICALGLTIGSRMLFTPHKPESFALPIESADPAGGGKTETPIGVLMASADPAKGEAIFAKCAACHTINSGGANGIGPNLYGTMGEAIGQGKGGFAFSDALKSVGGSWGFENMSSWLTSPRKFAPGTKMTFAGLSSPEDRANLMAYINAQGSNLPMPKVEEAPAADAPATDAKAPAEGAAEAAAPTPDAAEKAASEPAPTTPAAK